MRFRHPALLHALTLSLLLFVAGCNASTGDELPDTFQGKVVEIVDMDTLLIEPISIDPEGPLADKGPVRVRLAMIDAPEAEQVRLIRDNWAVEGALDWGWDFGTIKAWIKRGETYIVREESDFLFGEGPDTMQLDESWDDKPGDWPPSDPEGYTSVPADDNDADMVAFLLPGPTWDRKPKDGWHRSTFIPGGEHPYVFKDAGPETLNEALVGWGYAYVTEAAKANPYYREYARRNTESLMGHLHRLKSERQFLHLATPPAEFRAKQRAEEEEAEGEGDS